MTDLATLIVYFLAAIGVACLLSTAAVVGLIVQHRRETRPTLAPRCLPGALGSDYDRHVGEALELAADRPLSETSDTPIHDAIALMFARDELADDAIARWLS